MKRFSIVLIALLTVFNIQVNSKGTPIVSAPKKKVVEIPEPVEPAEMCQLLKKEDHLGIRVRSISLKKIEDLSRAVNAGSNGDQYSKPFYSNDENLILSGIEYMYSVGNAPFTNNGNIVFTYDANGITTGYESTQINKDNIINLCNENNFYPIDATVKTVVNNDPDDYSKETYYIDPVDGERHDISITKYKYFNDEPVLTINKALDENGIMTDYAKVESQFDNQGRPVVTFVYTPHFTEQHKMYLDLYRKYEYEYLSDNMISKTTYSLIDQDGNRYWENYQKIVSGYDTEGYYCYEMMEYDTLKSTWTGSRKYRCLLSDDETQYTEINWAWDIDGNEWILSDKSFSIYNSNDLTTYQENYLYDTALGTFYMSSKCGYEFQGDTLQISDWLIVYNAPESLEQLSQQDARINFSRKNEYFYNKDNMVTSAAHFVLNDKCEWFMVSKEATLYYASGLIRNYNLYTLDIQGADTTWVIDELDNVEIDNAGNIILDESYSTWDKDINTWQTGSIHKWNYSPDGKLLSDILYSIEMGDTTCDKTLISYDDAGRTEMISKYLQYPHETDWILYNKEEYTFDSSARTLTSQKSDLDQNGQWHVVYKTFRQLDSNDRTLLYESYTWDYEGNSWIGETKEENQYNEQGDTTMIVSYIWNDMLNNWVGNEKSCYYSIDDSISLELYYWDYDRNDWYGYTKVGYYSDEDKYIEASYIWNFETWCWEGIEKSEYIFGSDDYNFTCIEYDWDADNMNWQTNEMYIFENQETDTYTFNRTTVFGWNSLTSRWDCDYRDTQWQYLNNVGNLDYILTTSEKIDDQTNDWKTIYTLKDVHIYTARTNVESIKANDNITVSDGNITVLSAHNGFITICTAAGTPIATGQGTLSVPAIPGTYLITIDNKTTKVIVF